MPALASVSIETLFAPFEDTAGAFLAFVQSAERSLFTVIYGCHLPAYSDILIAKHQAGVEVGLILDHSQEAGKAERGEVQRLIDAGVPLLVGTSPVHHQILHSKFTVVDEAAVEFGSWNYSLSASAQSNTVSLIRDAPYAKPFLAHYDRLRSFILLHEMCMQPQGETPAPAALPDAAPAEPVAEATPAGQTSEAA